MVFYLAVINSFIEPQAFNCYSFNDSKARMKVIGQADLIFLERLNEKYFVSFAEADRELETQDSEGREGRIISLEAIVTYLKNCSWFSFINNNLCKEMEYYVSED